MATAVQRDPAAQRGAPWFDRLHLANVRCFEQAVVPLGRRVTVILGENGAGKTTVAEALASLSFGEREGLAAFPLRRDGEASTAEVALYEVDAEAPAAWWGPGPVRRRLPEGRYLFAYGRYRRVQFPEDQAEQGFAADLLARVSGRRTTTLFEPDNHILRDLGPTLIEINGLRRTSSAAEAVWQALEVAVKGLGHRLTGLGVIEREGQDVVIVRRGDLELPLRELSDGYQAMLVIVLDLVIRYAYLSPPLDEPMRRPATVVIDEVDLHLHPRWQRKVIGQLTRLFPETQFILTTHSPAVVQGAIDSGHDVLVLRSFRGRARIHTLTGHERRTLQGAQLGSVLIDQRLFGVSSRYSPTYGVVEQRIRRLREKMEAGTATEAERTALIDALDEMEGLLVAEERRQGDGPLLSEIARVQLASLKRLAQLNREAEHGKA